MDDAGLMQYSAVLRPRLSQSIQTQTQNKMPKLRNRVLHLRVGIFEVNAESGYVDSKLVPNMDWFVADIVPGEN